MRIRLLGIPRIRYSPTAVVSRSFKTPGSAAAMSSSSSPKPSSLEIGNGTGGASQRRPNLAISEDEDNPEIRAKYRPFLLDTQTIASDWISELELDTVTTIAQKDLERTGSRLKVLVLYGSLRKR